MSTDFFVSANLFYNSRTNPRQQVVIFHITDPIVDVKDAGSKIMTSQTDPCWTDSRSLSHDRLNIYHLGNDIWEEVFLVTMFSN